MLQARFDVVEIEIRSHQPHAAVDVVADAAGRNDPALFGISGAYASDTKPVAPVDVGHGETRVLDPRQERHVGDLFGSLIMADLFDERVVGEDEPVDAHPGLVRLGNPPQVVVDLLERPVKSSASHRPVSLVCHRRDVRSRPHS